MATQTKPMTTREFAKASGIPAAAITKLIRDGKLKAQKEGNAWKIPPSQLDSKTVREFEKSAKAASPKKSSEAASASQPPKASEPGAGAPAPQTPPAEKTYSIPEFAAMTYLTEKGVSEWLRTGKLQGVKTQAGEWRVMDNNLQVPFISRLARK
jgi:excisionase family DNA binding protein